MNNFIWVFDACTLINIFCIDDESDFLFRKINLKLDLRISDFVYREVRSNYKFRKSLRDNISQVEIKLGKLVPRITYNKDVSEFFDYNYFDEIGKRANYKKRNGEFYSVSLAFFVSQIEETNVTFVTDDIPAKNDFNLFYWKNQIGLIADTVDLLLLVFRLDENLKKRNIIDFLDNLHSEYALSISQLVKELKLFLSSINSSRKYRRKGGLKRKLSDLINQFERNDLSNIIEKRSEIEQEKDMALNAIFSKHNEAFSVSHSSKTQNYLTKIREAQELIKTNQVFRIMA